MGGGLEGAVLRSNPASLKVKNGICVALRDVCSYQRCVQLIFIAHLAAVAATRVRIRASCQILYIQYKKTRDGVYGNMGTKRVFKKVLHSQLELLRCTFKTFIYLLYLFTCLKRECVTRQKRKCKPNKVAQMGQIFNKLENSKLSCHTLFNFDGVL